MCLAWVLVVTTDWLGHVRCVVFACHWQEGERVVMVQEFADGGDLFNLLQKYGGCLSERVAVQMVLDPFLRVLQVSTAAAGYLDKHIVQWVGRCQLLRVLFSGLGTHATYVAYTRDSQGNSVDLLACTAVPAHTRHHPP